MDEEILNLNTDLKEMFVEQKYDELEAALNAVDKININEIILYNWNIINKYYDEGNFNILIQYIKFVAYNCYLTEMAYKESYIDENVYGEMMEVYDDIYVNIRK